MSGQGSSQLRFRDGIRKSYADILTPLALDALDALVRFDNERKQLMRAAHRTAHRSLSRRVGGSHFSTRPLRSRGQRDFSVQQARRGVSRARISPTTSSASGSRARDPATKPRATVQDGIRNVAYALLSGADGWMFDGEDALGQVDTMSLDNQRNLRIALAREKQFLTRR
jgi:malate synthase